MQVEFQARHHEARYRGLQQTLNTFDGTLHELQKLSEDHKRKTAKVTPAP